MAEASGAYQGLHIEKLSAVGVRIGEGVTREFPMQWSPGKAFLAYLRPTEHFWYRENSVALLNKAGPTSEQSYFVSRKNLLN